MKKEIVKEAIKKAKADRKAKKNGVIIHQEVTRTEYEDLLRRVQILESSIRSNFRPLL
jgi:hypothetical protein